MPPLAHGHPRVRLEETDEVHRRGEAEFGRNVPDGEARVGEERLGALHTQRDDVRLHGRAVHGPVARLERAHGTAARNPAAVLAEMNGGAGHAVQPLGTTSRNCAAADLVADIRPPRHWSRADGAALVDNLSADFIGGGTLWMLK